MSRTMRVAGAVRPLVKKEPQEDTYKTVAEAKAQRHLSDSELLAAVLEKTNTSMEAAAQYAIHGECKHLPGEDSIHVMGLHVSHCMRCHNYIFTMGLSSTHVWFITTNHLMIDAFKSKFY